MTMPEIRSITREDADACEWDPFANRPAIISDQWHADAELLVGSHGQWRLCRSCAALPQFRRFRTRKPLGIGGRMSRINT